MGESLKGQEGLTCVVTLICCVSREENISLNKPFCHQLM